ncbi:MAG: hypothetical protein EAZ55_00350 [Cytophagales bacterium]|nr:MAG: hypothetical protein EAZ55_00350 [Cytophagales bacterium]
MLLGGIACQSTPKNDIINTWSIDTDAMSKEMEEKRKQSGKNEPAHKTSDEYTLFIMKGLKMTFKDEGILIVEMKDQKQEGTWALSEDGKNLTMETQKGKPQRVTIEKLNANEMIFEPSPAEGKDAFRLIFKPAE